MPSVAKLHQQNYEFSSTPGFASWCIREIRQRGIRILRVHTAGDLYNVEYAEKWLTIATSLPNVKFFGYTRSWRSPEILPVLRSIGRLPNFSLWYSIDRETGPAPLDPNIRQAYLALSDEDASTAPYTTDLIFRDNPKTAAKNFNGTVVCPVENGVEHASGFKHTCSTCQLCVNKKPGHAAASLLAAHAIELRAPVVKRKVKVNARTKKEVVC